MTTTTTLTDRAVLVTGANRGLGQPPSRCPKSLRALIAGRGVTVHIALPGPIDTDMIREWDIPKTAASDVADAIVNGIANGDEEIFPDPMSGAVAPSRRGGAIKTLERQNANAVRALRP